MRILAFAAVLTALTLTSFPAAAQSSTGPTNRTRSGPDRIAGTPFSDVPYRVESLGLSLRLPEGANISSTSTADGVRSFLVAPAANNWLLRVLGPRVADPSLTPAQIAASMINELLDPDGKNETLGTMRLTTPDGRKRVFDRLDELQTSSATGARFYVAVKQPDGQELITGYSVFSPAPGQLVVFEINCLGPELATVRPVYEAIVAGATIEDPAQLASRRAAGVTAGEALLADLDAETITSVLPRAPEWRRLYRPGPTGRWSDDEEMAYQMTEIREGRRGELATGRTQRSWSASEREKGFIARVVARYLDGERRVDVLSTYFLSLDGASEAWSVRMRITERFDTTNWTETGVRTGGEIRVSIAQPDGTVTDKAWPEPPTGYLSHVEALLMPRLLAARGIEGDLAYYRYNSQLSELTLRRDEFSASADGWTLTTRSHEDGVEEVIELDTNGDVQTLQIGDDVAGRTSDQKTILGIWRHKGLPIE